MINIPGMTPEVADIARDVLALARAAGHGDTEGVLAIIGGLNQKETYDRLISMASLCAALMHEQYGDDSDEHMDEFIRRFLT